MRELFGSVAKEFEFERHVNWVEAESLEEFADLPEPLPDDGGRAGDARRPLRRAPGEGPGIWRDANEAGDGGLRFPQAYLLSIVRV